MESNERELVLKHLTESRDRMRNAVAGISQEQLHFKPEDDKWSVAGCIEHLAIVESGIQIGIQRSLQSPADPDKEAEIRAKDHIILQTVPARGTRVKGPDRVMPQGRWTGKDELIDAFENARGRSIQMAGELSEGLYQHFFDHPVIGPMNCYQWLLFLGTHCERHVKQMEEIMAHPSYPRSSAATV